jgi:hypothetical protein
MNGRTITTVATKKEKDWLDRPYVKVLIVSLFLNYACTVYGRGTFAHVTITLAVIFLVGVPLALIGFVFDCILKKKQGKTKKVLKILWWIVTLIFLQALSIEFGQVLLQKDVENAKAFCESLIPSLEAYKKDVGVYPETLDDLLFFHEQMKAQAAELPWMLVEVNSVHPEGVPFYARNGAKGFSFFFVDPADIGTRTYVYSSENKTWDLK